MGRGFGLHIVVAGGMVAGVSLAEPVGEALHWARERSTGALSGAVAELATADAEARLRARERTRLNAALADLNDGRVADEATERLVRQKLIQMQLAQQNQSSSVGQRTPNTSEVPFSPGPQPSPELSGARPFAGAAVGAGVAGIGAGAGLAPGVGVAPGSGAGTAGERESADPESVRPSRGSGRLLEDDPLNLALAPTAPESAPGGVPGPSGHGEDDAGAAVVAPPLTDTSFRPPRAPAPSTRGASPRYGDPREGAPRDGDLEDAAEDEAAPSREALAALARKLNENREGGAVSVADLAALSPLVLLELRQALESASAGAAANVPPGAEAVPYSAPGVSVTVSVGGGGAAVSASRPVPAAEAPDSASGVKQGLIPLGAALAALGGKSGAGGYGVIAGTAGKGGSSPLLLSKVPLAASARRGERRGALARVMAALREKLAFPGGTAAVPPSRGLASVRFDEGGDTERAAPPFPVPWTTLGACVLAVALAFLAGRRFDRALARKRSGARGSEKGRRG